ncbi:ATP-dependent DNA helicase [Saxibacter everestensis]|uniref:DNA 3'-5' helicase n=1 Tax=Saxibacter everestensis TaxID=2909229 RepID=A0ABY8QQ71_9MICO|nr:ATP-dependent DNA helicase [Brevibacteriaceae bacterium ZFBP1038]
MNRNVIRYSAADIATILARPLPTEEQRAVIEAPLEPGLVVAGAGSGKTETMASRVVWLVANQFVDPDAILGLTFTRKAAGELAERVRKRLRALRHRKVIAASATELGLGEATVSTYNAYAASLVRDHGLRIAVEPGASLLSEAGRWQLAAEVVEAASADELGFLDKPFGSVVSAVLQLASGCAEHLREPEEILGVTGSLREMAERLPKDARAFERSADRHPPAGTPYAAVQAALGDVAAKEALVPLVRRFLELKRDRGVLDFGDQVQLAAQLASTVDDVRRDERERWSVVLLDEYQDTSVSQLVLLKSLFGDGHPVTAVGDPHQSIYGWRGASSGNLGRFPQDFAAQAGSPAQVRYLSTSWRNDAAVLDAANTLAKPLRADGVPGPELKPRPGVEDGAITVSVLAGAVDAHTGLRDEDQSLARWVAEQRDLKRSVAVLCRRRSQFPGIEASLRLAGIPVEVVGLGGLLGTPEIIDIVCALQVVHDPDRGDSLMRLLTSPRWQLGARDLAALSDWSRQLHASRLGSGATDGPATAEAVDSYSLADGLDGLPPVGWHKPGESEPAFSSSGHHRLHDLSATLRELRRRSGQGLVDLVREVERALLLDIEVAARPGYSTSAARAHLDAFAEVAYQFSSSGDAPTLGAFISWLDAAQSEERGLQLPTAEPNPDAVQLLTVHASKGLEWDAVAIPDLVEGVFPGKPKATSGWLQLGQIPTELRGDRDQLPGFHWRDAEHQADLRDALDDFKDRNIDHHRAEERRLAYVALTRARTSLWLSASFWGAGVNPREPSTYLAELVGGGVITDSDWPEQPVKGEANPIELRAREEEWPPVAGSSTGREPAARDDAADLVLSCLERAAAERTPAQDAAEQTADQPPVAAGPERSVNHYIDLLLAERDIVSRGPATVSFPSRISPTRLIAVDRDPAAAAASIARPMPRPPSHAARLGTAFHEWLEQRYGQAALFELDEAEVARDPFDHGGLGAQGRANLAKLQTTFLASRFAALRPMDVERVFEIQLGELTIPGKIDAIFDHGAGQYEVVDWKTGRAPTPTERSHTELQLALYRVAFSEQESVPLQNITTTFFYLGSNEEVSLADLPDSAELESRFAQYYKQR